MIVSAEALGLEEDLSRVKASVTDLITAEEARDMAGPSRTWNFGPSLMTKGMIEELHKLGCFGEAPPQGETIPKPQATDVVVFKDFSFVAFASQQRAFFTKSLKHSRYSCIILLPTVLFL